MIPAAQYWIIQNLFQHKRLLFLTTLGSIVDIFLFSLPPLIVAEILKVLFSDNQSINQSFQQIINWILIFLIIALIQISFFFMAGFVNEVLAHRVTTDITAVLFETLQNRSLSYLDSHDIGEIMARATNDTRILNIGISPAYRIIIQYFLQIFVVVAMLLWFEPRFIVFMLIYIIGYLWLNFRYVKRIYPKQKQLLLDFEQISSLSNESFTGILELKSFSVENNFDTKFEVVSQKHAKTIWERGKIQAFYYPSLFFWISAGVISIIGIYWILEGSLLISNFAGAFGAFLIFRFLSDALGWATTESVAAVAASNRLYNIIFEEEENIESKNNELPFNQEDVKIEFDHVWFRYNNDSDWVLKDVSFTINKDSTVVLIGPPGSGKTTINKLLQRLYIVQKGEIRIGSRNIQDFDKSFLKHVATIEQSPFLFSDTILNNIKYGKQNATQDEVDKVSELAQAKEFILKLPQGFDTQIGDRGVKLSGGERQRLAIARALLLDPSIIIMDDASSALDSKTEMLIQTSITNVLKTRTALITTNRLAIVIQADNIILLDKGSIIAEGTHKELITSAEEYRRLFDKYFNLPPLMVK